MSVSSKGVAANCASALAQMAAASCVQEEKEEKEIQEPGDAIAQGNSRRARIHLVLYMRSAHTHTLADTLVPVTCVSHSILHTTDDEIPLDHRLGSALPGSQLISLETRDILAPGD